MMLFAQIPGADEAIAAASRSGWEAVVLVVVMLTCVGFLVYVVRTIMAQALAREERLSKRIDALEEFIRTTLVTALQDNTKAMLNTSVQAAESTKALSDLIESLHTTRLCFATGEHQARLIDAIASRVVHEIRIKREDGTS